MSGRERASSCWPDALRCGAIWVWSGLAAHLSGAAMAEDGVEGDAQLEGDALGAADYAERSSHAYGWQGHRRAPRSRARAR